MISKLTENKDDYLLSGMLVLSCILLYFIVVKLFKEKYALLCCAIYGLLLDLVIVFIPD